MSNYSYNFNTKQIKCLNCEKVDIITGSTAKQLDELVKKWAKRHEKCVSEQKTS